MTRDKKEPRRSHEQERGAIAETGREGRGTAWKKIKHSHHTRTVGETMIQMAAHGDVKDGHQAHHPRVSRGTTSHHDDTHGRYYYVLFHHTLEVSTTPGRLLLRPHSPIISPAKHKHITAQALRANGKGPCAPLRKMLPGEAEPLLCAVITIEPPP